MTNPTDPAHVVTNSTDTRPDLVERLRRTEKRKAYFSTARTAPVIESEYDAPINPDGDEAAATIERLTEAAGNFLDIWEKEPNGADTVRAAIALRAALSGKEAGNA